jgi:hypothetical protein
MRRLGRVTVSAITLAGLMVLPATAQGADCIVIVPVGERLSSNAGLTQVRVLRSGPDPGGAWQDERVNALEDYQQSFKESGAPRTAGIAVLTDADDTRSLASGDYADFRACRN